MRRNWQCTEWKKINDLNYTACASNPTRRGAKGRQEGALVHALVRRRSGGVPEKCHPPRSGHILYLHGEAGLFGS